MQNLTIDVFVLRFLVSTHTALFYPDKKDSLYKVVAIDHQSKHKYDTKTGALTVTNWYAVDQFGPTLNLVVNCQQVMKFPMILQPALTS